MNGFCGSEFWNTTLTWETDDPDLTPCFQQTVLVWAPCAFLWAFSALDVYYIISSKKRFVPWSFLNISKLSFTVFLILLTSADLDTAIHKNRERYAVTIVTPVIKLLSFVITIVLLVYNKLHGLQTSGVLFLFWFLLFILGIPQYRSEIRQQQNRDNDSVPYQFISYMIYYPVVFVLLILNCFADKPPKESDYPKVENPCPVTGASFLSRIFFCWSDAFVWKGYRTTLTFDHVWSLNPENAGCEIIPQFDKYWKKSVLKYKSKEALAFNLSEESTKPKKPSVIPALIKTFGATYLLGVLYCLVHIILVFVSPQILRILIDFVKNEDVYSWRGYFYAALLFISATLLTIFESKYYITLVIIGMRMRTVLISAIYRKALCMSNTARKESTVGQIVNLMAVDTERMLLVPQYVNLMWSAPLQIALALFFLWEFLGPCVLAGIAMMICTTPIQGIIGAKFKSVHIRLMKCKDDRVKVMNELLNGIKVLKLSAWEPSFEKQILNIRDKELQLYREEACLYALVILFWMCMPFCVSLISFATFVLLDENNVLDSQTAFVSLAIFNIMRYPLTLLPISIFFLLQAAVSLKRINRFMNSDELDPTNVEHDIAEENPIIIQNGKFAWEAEQVVLQNINLSVPSGSLQAIVGRVGSGKTSLLSALLGEMIKLDGRVNTVGSIAYVAQQAWIQNATLQDNILFGKALDHELYARVVEACALKPDIEMLPGGDQTEIGEKGINLSGGQKQRVALARAVYNDADIYFLDDPLSAVDSHVGKHLFEKVIGPTGMLRKKTRVLVTHGITYLTKTDNIAVLNGGQITESGTYQELVDKKGAFAEFLAHHIVEVKKVDEEFQGAVENNLPNIKGDEENAGENLIETEKAETGKVKWSVYAHYLKCIGVHLSVASLMFHTLYQVFSILSNVWLSVWSTDANAALPEVRNKYLGVYGMLGLGQGISIYAGTVIIIGYGTIQAGRILHNLMLSTVLRAPITTFFDVTPIGRILNRFSRDVDVMDNLLPYSINSFVNIFLQVLGILLVICLSTPTFTALILPIAVVYYVIQRYYISTSRQLKRLQSVSKSPIYSHFGESLIGTSTIRAYGIQDRFIKLSEIHVDANQECYYAISIADRWLAVRLEIIGNLILLFATMFAINERSSTVGLTITYALQITTALNVLVRMTAEVESNVVSVERIKEYTEIKTEAPWYIPETSPPEDWPVVGQVEFRDVQIRYRDGLDPVLRGVSFIIEGGEKVGIVGRTGAGKSSLTLALFRIIEATDGTILIDDLDISKIGLHSLRSKLTIIPQDPVLFCGTLRLNLDPFNKHSNEEIWTCLELGHLATFIKGLALGLDHEIAEGGSNLSIGQRQLVCLARALLRKTKILVLDEATAAVDLETDDLIQATIRTEFKQCTILTIAHRLNTILDSDKVIVLDNGNIAEFAPPEELLSNKSSMFYNMAKDAGIV